MSRYGHFSISVDSKSLIVKLHTVFQYAIIFLSAPNPFSNDSLLFAIHEGLMDNQPTLKEYLHSYHGGVIMSHDGSFYSMEKQTSRMYDILSTAISILLYVALISLLWTTLWYNVSIDLMLYEPLRSYIKKRLEYKYCRFKRIEESNEEYDDSIEWLQKRTKGDRIQLRVFISLAIAFGIAISFTALSIRSLFENQHNISNMRISYSVVGNSEEFRITDCENLSELSFPDQVTGIDIDTDISGSPSSYQFKLNGRLLPNIHSYKQLSAIWDEEIFPQNYFGSLPMKDLHDNSVLEISSGSFSRQWTIKTE